MDTITNEQLKAYAAHLRAEEREASTIDKYARDLREFSAWLEARELDKEAASQWKVYLLDNGLAPVTVNGKLAALNGFLRFLGREDCRVRALKVQRRVLREQRRELDRAEYVRLVETARREGRERLALLLETICATGIRVSELRFVTVEAARVGRADVSLKGKIRTILLPKKLCRKLLKYAGARKIASGAIFRARGGEPISRKRVWAEMKELCEKAGVAPEKVFPHNLRHLFARLFYQVCRDIVKLADVLGHSSIETTRIYLIATGAEHAEQLERMRLVC